MMSKTRILFACKANAGRSVTSKVLTEHYARGRGRGVLRGVRAGRPRAPGGRAVPGPGSAST